jgi:hypothetical protein
MRFSCGQSLARLRNSRHFEKQLSCITSGNSLKQFEEVDFIPAAAASMTFETMRAVGVLPYRKTGVPIFVEWTPGTFLRLLAQTELLHKLWQRKPPLCVLDVAAHHSRPWLSI